MKKIDRKSRWLGLAVLAGVAGTMVLTILRKPRTKQAGRFLRDFPAHGDGRFLPLNT